MSQKDVQLNMWADETAQRVLVPRSTAHECSAEGFPHALDLVPGQDLESHAIKAVGS